MLAKIGKATSIQVLSEHSHHGAVGALKEAIKVIAAERHSSCVLSHTCSVIIPLLSLLWLNSLGVTSSWTLANRKSTSAWVWGDNDRVDRGARPPSPSLTIPVYISAGPEVVQASVRRVEAKTILSR